jgi:hypothetical protein
MFSFLSICSHSADLIRDTGKRQAPSQRQQIPDDRSLPVIGDHASVRQCDFDENGPDVLSPAGAASQKGEETCVWLPLRTS